MRQRKILKLLISIVALLIVLGIVAYNRYTDMTKFNDSYVNGNTGGNLYNGGYFCEYEGMIYFRNPNDNNRLYSMDRNGNNITRLSEDTASYINVDAHYVYYTRSNANDDSSFSFLNIETHSLCRLAKSNHKIEILDSDPCIYASLIGNYVYYSHYDEETASTVYRVKIDGSEKECVLDAPITAVSANGQHLYYTGVESNAFVYAINTANGGQSTVLDTNAYMPIVSDGYLYYINCDKGYRLEKMNLSSGEVTTLTRDRVDCYNVYGSTVFYQSNEGDASGLYRMKYDGYDYETEALAMGNYTNINVTSTYVYFMRYGAEDVIYCTPTLGRVNIQQFSPTIEE